MNGPNCTVFLRVGDRHVSFTSANWMMGWTLLRMKCGLLVVSFGEIVGLKGSVGSLSQRTVPLGTGTLRSGNLPDDERAGFCFV